MWGISTRPRGPSSLKVCRRVTVRQSPAGDPGVFTLCGDLARTPTPHLWLPPPATPLYPLAWMEATPGSQG